MHTFLRAVGFSAYKTRNEIDKLIEQILLTPTKEELTHTGYNKNLSQITAMFHNNLGISIVGEYDQELNFHMDHYFPFCPGQFGTTCSLPLSYCKMASSNSYLVSYEDTNDCLIIFYLQNISDYVKYYWSNETICKGNVVLSGLSTSGTILLGSYRTSGEWDKKNPIKIARGNCLATARQGNTRAMQDLEKIDAMIYNNIAQRLNHSEDILSIVDTTFMPCGLESDQYFVIGTILESTRSVNSLTREVCWILALEANEIHLTVCINEKDLCGEPMEGRRFKGVIWLQGSVEIL